MPISVLVMISSVSVRESMHPMPLRRNMLVPITSNRSLLPRTDQRPASNINGMISSEGNDSSIDVSRFVASGNRVFMRSSIGEIAKPGNDTIADMDHIATRAMSGITPFPVFIAILFKMFSYRRATPVPNEYCE